MGKKLGLLSGHVVELDVDPTADLDPLERRMIAAFREAMESQRERERAAGVPAAALDAALIRTSEKEAAAVGHLRAAVTILNGDTGDREDFNDAIDLLMRHLRDARASGEFSRPTEWLHSIPRLADGTGNPDVRVWRKEVSQHLGRDVGKLFRQMRKDLKRKK